MPVRGRGHTSCLRGWGPGGHVSLTGEVSPAPPRGLWPPLQAAFTRALCSTHGRCPGCTQALSGSQARENNPASKKVHFPTGQGREGGSTGRTGIWGTTALAAQARSWSPCSLPHSRGSQQPLEAGITLSPFPTEDMEDMEATQLVPCRSFWSKKQLVLDSHQFCPWG